MLRIGFLSSAAPQWDLATLLTTGRALGFTALEPRVEWRHGHGLERDRPAAWPAARRQAEDLGMAISAVALGSRLNQQGAEARRAAVDDIVAYAELAATAGATVLRVFGGPMPADWAMEQARPYVAEALGQAAERCAPFGVRPCLETHDDFWNPADVAWCARQAGSDNVGVTWHAAHHLRAGRDISAEAAFTLIGPWVRHVHMQEFPSAADTSEPASTPLPLGQGDGSSRRQVAILVAAGYDGTLSLEWLNRGAKPADPRPPLEQYATTLRQWLAEIADAAVRR